MVKHLRFALLAGLAIAAFAVPAAAGTCLPDGVQSSGAAYRICMPNPGKWNGRLVLFAHGYVDVNEPTGIPEDQLTLPDGTSVPNMINALGYAFAVSGYSVNGLAVLQGIADTADLIDIFSSAVGPPAKVYIIGPSEGGLVTALSVERFPNLYAGGTAACGPIGDFPAQVNYIGDFRVIFDYFFPGVIPGSAVSVPQIVMDQWESTYLPQIRTAVAANPSGAAQLLKVTGAATGPNSTDAENTIETVLWYAVFSADDATAKLGGQPYDNHKKLYSGSSNDFLLNLLVARFTASPAALHVMQSQYNTTGHLSKPLITMHTLGDQIIPYWHEPLYTLKTLAANSASQRISLPIQAYGHCNFNAAQALAAFVLMIVKADGTAPAGAAQLLPTQALQQQFQQLIQGAN